MGNLCSGENDTGEGFNDVGDDDDMDDWGAFRAEKPSDTVALNINSLPTSYKKSDRLSKLQELISNMRANQKKGKKILKINRRHDDGLPLDDPYLIRMDNSLYIGQWKFSHEIDSTVPGGIGRLYKEDEIMEGEMLTFIDEDQKNKGDFRTGMAEKMIRETKKRAKFFQKDKEAFEFGEVSNLVRKFKIVIDGEGRIFSRTMELSGEFTKGKLNGKGEMSIKYDNDLYHFKGEFIDGQKHGKGVQTYKNVVYDGDFKDNLKTGKGTLTLFISNKFSKEVEDQDEQIQKDMAQRNPADIIHCIEDFIKLRNQEFQEPFQKEMKKLTKSKWSPPQKKREKLSFLDDPNFLLEHIRKTKYSEHYKGEFNANEFQGFGRYTWFNGKCYQGTWKNGKMDGYGQFFWQKGIQYYRGEYKDDMKHGKGELRWSLTRMYRGSWAFGLRHGYGELIQVNQMDEELSGKEQVNNNLLGIFSREEKKKAQVKVIGGLFQKDKLLKTFFEETFTLQLDIDNIRKEQNKMVCFVKGIRYQEDKQGI